jgi:hypothetical protein
MAEITSASQEQSGGIEQVNQAIGQMDQVTQQNAALVEEAAAAAASMQDQAGKLAEVVSVFRLDREPQVAAAAAPVVRAAPARAAVPAPKAIAAAPIKAAAVKRKEPVVTDGDDWEEF